MIGKIISHYKIIEKLGEGGMGIVYKAEDSELNRIVALKLLPGYLMDKTRLRTRLKREARAAASLNHPNICTIYGFHETGEIIFIVMEYIEGQTLKQLIEKEAPLNEENAKKIIIQVTEGLSAAHNKGIIHRDIKSDNIMFTKDGVVKIMDFGLAKMEQTPTITQTKSPMGTVAYMSPELVKGEKVDHRTDLWSLGVVLYEMLTGTLPFAGDSDVSTMYSIIGDNPPKLTKYNSDVSGSLQYICTTLLEKDLSIRYQQADNVLKDLKQSIKGSTTKLFIRKVQRNYKRISATIFLIFAMVYFANYYYQTKVNIPPWLKRSAKLVPIIDEIGPYDGVISPSGKYLTYRDRDNRLGIKNLVTGESQQLRKKDYGTFWLPTWSQDETEIAYIGGPANNISIVDIISNKKSIILEKHEGYIMYFTWSPNGKWFCYLYTEFNINQETSYLELYDIRTAEKRILFETKFSAVNLMTWYPDASQIAFYYYDFDSLKNNITKCIKLIEIESGIVSTPIYKLINNYIGSKFIGFSFSPDGKFLVFPEKVDNFIELVALPVKNHGTKIAGKPITLTNFAGTGRPYRPCFTEDGKSFSFNVGKHNEDIFIASIDINQTKLANRLIPTCVTKYVERDACWLPCTKEIAYTSNQSGQSNIYISNPDTQTKRQLTSTNLYKNQLSINTDKNSVSYISEDILWQVNLKDSSVTRIYPRAEDSLYFQASSYQCYAWVPNSDLLYGLLKDDKNKKSGRLMEINLQNRKTKILLEEYFSLPYSELRLSRDGKFLAIRTEITDTTLFTIKIYNTESWKLINTIYHVSAIEFGDISWTPDNLFFTYGTWSEKSQYFLIYLYSIEQNTKKLLIERRGTVRDIPGQISPDGKEMIYYRTSIDSEIWSLGGN